MDRASPEIFDDGRRPLRIAVVGAGIAGLGAAWLLGRRHRVVLYEAQSRLGGHTHTIDVELEGCTHPVDTGFLVFNRRTYPELCGLFNELQVPLAASDMSFAVSLPQQDLEWAGRNLFSVFGQRRNLLRPGFWAMLDDIFRFNREARALAREHETPRCSLGAYLAEQGYGANFRDGYLLPMAASIWSCPPAQMLAYPLASFLQFCLNHGLLQLRDRPRWLTVLGGGREYVLRMRAELADVRVATPVRRVRRYPQGVELATDYGAETFDAVVFACHSDQALALLGEGASQPERAVLGAIRYQPNRAVVHTDAGLLPQRRMLWSAWNYSAGVDSDGRRAVSVSYLLNRLQPLPFRTPVIVSLNPWREPAPPRVLRELAYEHPVFDQAAIDAQAHLPMLQGRQRTWFCGAWTGFGFHEDGLRSAVHVAAALGCVAPWRARCLPDLPLSAAV